MSKKQSRQDPLRAAAEARIGAAPEARPRSAEALWHELQVQRIELEMQAETLRASETLKQRILDSISANIAVLDCHGVIVAVNAPWRRFALENSPEAGLPARNTGVGVNYLEACRTHYDAAHSDALEAREGIRAVLEGRLPNFSLEYLCTAPGQQRWFLMSATPLGMSEPCVVITHTEISALKHAEREARASLDQFRSLFEHSMDAIMLTTPEGGVLAANPAAQRMFGYSEAEIRRLGRRGLVDADDPGLAAALRQRDEEGRFSGTLTFIGKGGRKFPVEISSSVFASEDGRLMTSMFVRDISERRRRELELGTLRAELQQLLEWQVARHTVAALAHEINQPLSSLSALSEAASRMLAADAAGATAASRQLDGILRRMADESMRAGEVVRKLLQSMHMPSSRAESVELAPILIEAIRSAQSSRVSDYRVTLDCPADLPPVRANRLHVVKVILNLIGNAIEAMRHAGHATGLVRIGAVMTADGAEACISVQDDGPGVEAGMAHEIFHPFVSTKPDNIGMGLAICHALIEAQGGKLWHEADAAPGATFRFTLPVARRPL